MYCIKCGKENSIEARYCKFCGENITVINNTLPANHKTKKKRYLYCDNCQTYSRWKTKKISPLVLLIIFLGWIIFLLALLLPRDEKKVCKKCGNIKNLQQVFFETELDEKGKEIAYILPSGEKMTNNG